MVDHVTAVPAFQSKSLRPTKFQPYPPAPNRRKINAAVQPVVPRGLVDVRDEDGARSPPNVSGRSQAAPTPTYAQPRARSRWETHPKPPVTGGLGRDRGDGATPSRHGGGTAPPRSAAQLCALSDRPWSRPSRRPTRPGGSARRAPAGLLVWAVPPPVARPLTPPAAAAHGWPSPGPAPDPLLRWPPRSWPG